MNSNKRRCELGRVCNIYKEIIGDNGLLNELKIHNLKNCKDIEL